MRVDGTTPVDVRSVSTARHAMGRTRSGRPCSRALPRPRHAPYQSDWMTDLARRHGSSRRLRRGDRDAGRRPAGQNVAMIRGASISGTITSAGGPVEGRLRLRLRAEPVGQRRTVGAPAHRPMRRASSALRGLPAGTYRLQVIPPTASDLLNAWIGGAANFRISATATQFTLALGGHRHGSRRRAPTGRWCAGSVLGEGTGIPDVWVYAIRQPPTAHRSGLPVTRRTSTVSTPCPSCPAGPVRLQAQINTYTYGQSPFLTTWFDGSAPSRRRPRHRHRRIDEAPRHPADQGSGDQGTVLASGSAVRWRTRRSRSAT